MKRLLKKKISFFGKEVSVFVVVLLAVGLVGAALVPYLSGLVIGDIEVSSPMVTGISLGDVDWGEDAYPQGSHNLADWELTEAPLQISVHGGETVTLYTMSANEADVLITGFEKAIVTNTGITCDDFESVIVRVDSIYGDLGYGTPQELIGTGGCQVIDNDNIRFGSPANSIWDVGETDVSEIVVIFKTNALGTYTFNYQVIPEI